MNCTNCGKSIRPKTRDKFHRCSKCDQQIAKAKIADAWKVIKLGRANYLPFAPAVGVNGK